MGYFFMRLTYKNILISITSIIFILKIIVFTLKIWIAIKNLCATS